MTLVNGRFVASNAPTIFSDASPGLQVDLNVIPASLIEWIETVAVGGALIYGADAIAGTVNVILKNNFKGLEFRGSYGQASRPRQYRCQLRVQRSRGRHRIRIG